MNDRYYIGGGNIAGVMGVSPYKTPLDEYLTIIGDESAQPDEKRVKFFERRKSLEPFVVDCFKRETGIDVWAQNRRYHCATYDFMRAEIDFEPAIDSTTGEIKTVHPLAASAWGPSGSDELPVYVTAQAMWGLGITGRDRAFVIAMVGFDDVRIYNVHRDEETIEALYARAVAFWRDHVEPRVPPPASTAGDVLKLYGFSKDEQVLEATEDMQAHLGALRTLTEQSKEIEAEIERRREALQVAMGPATGITIGGKPVATWRWQESSRIDVTRLRNEAPDLAKKFNAVSRSRVFRIR